MRKISELFNKFKKKNHLETSKNWRQMRSIKCRTFDKLFDDPSTQVRVGPSQNERLKKWSYDLRCPSQQINNHYFTYSQSLYGSVNGKRNGDPNADSYFVLENDSISIYIVADGVGWGESSRSASTNSVIGAVTYLNNLNFATLTTSHDWLREMKSMIFAAHLKIISGMTTFCSSIVLKNYHEKSHLILTINVGDSSSFLHSNHQLIDLTIGSNHAMCNDDIYETGGCLGINNISQQQQQKFDMIPDLGNWSLSQIQLDSNEPFILLMMTDGISDNFDPFVTKSCVRLSEVVHTDQLRHHLPVYSKRERYQLSLQHITRMISTGNSSDFIGKKFVEYVESLTRRKRDYSSNLHFSRSENDRIPGKLDHATLILYKSD
ncbi:hypothetical protein SNEBB_010292 [Seison nebaliae]|nr:hypothetical protein SNEBB_010292 [Seison nebaliae]